MIDRDHLDKKLHEAIECFVETMTQAWLDIRKTQVLDLRQDPRPWQASVRAANTNGSILLDRYICLLAPEYNSQLRLEFAILWLTVGVVTEKSALFHPPR